VLSCGAIGGLNLHKEITMANRALNKVASTKEQS